MKLRSYLVFLTLAALIPVLVFAVYSSSLLVQRERATYRRGASDLTQALVTAIDTELRRSVDLLKALSTSFALDEDDIYEFHEEATRVLHGEPGWSNVHLARPSGEQVLNASVEPGMQLPKVAESQSFEVVLRTGKPAIGGVAFGALSREWYVAVRVPVVRDGRLQYVLTANVKAQTMVDLLSLQGMPAGWIAAVVDSNMRFVARTASPEKWIGQYASDSFRNAVTRASDSWARVKTVDGADVYVPYRRSKLSGWYVAIGIPVAVVDEAATNAAWDMTVGVLIAIFIAVLLTAFVGRRISRPLAMLAGAAEAMGRGRRIELPSTISVKEVRDVAAALGYAAASVQESERQLRQSEEHFRSLADNISQLAWMADASGHIYWYNQRWFDFTGTTLEEMEGLGWKTVIHQDHLDGVVERMSLCWRQEVPWEDTFLMRSKSGEWRWFLTRALPIRDHTSRVLRWFGTNTDVTDQFNAQEELRRKEKALREALQARDEFLSIASHELTTPLTSLRLQVTTFQRGRERGDSKVYTREWINHYVEKAERQVRRLTRLVDDMLDFARIRTGQMRIQKETTSLDEVVRGAIERLRPVLTNADTMIEVISKQPIEGVWDKFRLEQVITNLLTNAMRYGDRKPVRVTLDQIGTVARLSVCDQGIGLSAEARERIFDRFERSISADEVSGLGLGLYITRQIVEAHGGRIWAESEGLGRGATFVVELPIANNQGQGVIANVG